MSGIQQAKSAGADHHGAVPSAPASRLRITSGVFALIFAVLGILEVLVVLFSTPPVVPSTPLVGWVNFLLLVGSVGSLVTGIVLLAKQRKRGGATPWLVASFSVVGALCAMLIPIPNAAIPGFIGVVGLVSAAVGGLAIWLERRRPDASRATVERSGSVRAGDADF